MSVIFDDSLFAPWISPGQIGYKPNNVKRYSSQDTQSVGLGYKTDMYFQLFSLLPELG